MVKFRTINEECIEAEIVEKKSRFIASLFYVETYQEAEEKIKEVKKKYYDAKHNCFAYLVYENCEIKKKYSDDGEPSGTAGAPMMEILEKENLCNLVVVVTRYFGGILLGTGGLVRAYSDSLKKAIKKATLIEKEHGYEAQIKIAYTDFEKFKYYCNKNNINITSSTYTDIVVCNIEINEDEKSAFLNIINSDNELKIQKFDIVRQKNISKMSKNVD